MNEEALLRKRQANWMRLDELCTKSDTSVNHLSDAELREFISLYRRASNDLATLRTRSANEVLIGYLNDIVTRSYATLYRSPRQRAGEVVSKGIRQVAQTVRRNRVFVFASLAIFLFSIFFAAGLAAVKSPAADAILSADSSIVEHWTSGEHKQRSGDDDFGATGFYLSNNPRAALNTAALGAGSMGIISVFIVFLNGGMLGALAVYCAQAGTLDFLISSVMPHGVPELSGLVISGAAGLRFGWALVAPGNYSRGESLRRAGRDGITLLITSLLLMCIAAPIEGYFSFNPIVPGSLKWIVIAVETAAFTFYWGFFGRDGEEKTEEWESSVNANIVRLDF